MNILMLTNTFTPHVGGVARSVETFTAEYRRLGHRVMVVAPDFEGAPERELDVLRVPAIQNFNGSDFSVRLPILDMLSLALEDFQPDIVHSHHPFLLGDTALRVAAANGLPVVFTHHTMYESYTHYSPGDSPTLKRFVANLAVGYCNLCDHVIAPSESVQKTLRDRGVTVPITVIPTGVDTERFASGDRAGFRARHGIPEDAFVVGHLGRLAPEKNLGFLAQAVAAFLWRHPNARFLVVGSGPSEAEIVEMFRREKMDDRLHLAGICKGQTLIDAYRAMDVFAFASLSETQGMVLAEAMAAGLPAVALDAPGAREVVRDGVNGRLLMDAGVFRFASALESLAILPSAEFDAMKLAARLTAEAFSKGNCALRALALYKDVMDRSPAPRLIDDSSWASAIRLVKKEWDHWAAWAGAAGAALMPEDEESSRHD